MRKIAIHGKKIVINRWKIDELLDKKRETYTSLHEKVCAKFELDITYKGFMALLSNRPSWKLLYAYAIANVLNVNIEDIFVVENVNMDKEKEEKEMLRDKYKK